MQNAVMATYLEQILFCSDEALQQHDHDASRHQIDELCSMPTTMTGCWRLPLQVLMEIITLCQRVDRGMADESWNLTDI